MNTVVSDIPRIMDMQVTDEVITARLPMDVPSACLWPGLGAYRRQRQRSEATSRSSAVGWVCIGRMLMRISAQLACFSASPPDHAKPQSARDSAHGQPCVLRQRLPDPGTRRTKKTGLPARIMRCAGRLFVLGLSW